MSRDVPRIQPIDHARIDSVLEAQGMIGADRVVVVQTSRQE